LSILDLDLKSINKDCCDDHKKFCAELYGAEENLECKNTAEPPTTTTGTTITATTVTENTATTTTTGWQWNITYASYSWLFVRNQD